jgi:hypothetical protein
MAATITTICNLALSKIGARKVIDIDEESTEARACKTFFEEVRDDVLRSHRWSFAVTRVTLTQIASEPAFGWRNGFQQPTDCLRVFEVNGWDQARREGHWEIEGRLVMIDEESADIRYIRREVDCNVYDSIFIEAFATKLASAIVMPVNGSGQMSVELLKQYEAVTGSKARKIDAMEGRPRRRPAWQNSDLVFSRFRGV